MTVPEPTTTRRPRWRLLGETVSLMDGQRAPGLTPMPVHLMLVTKTPTAERGHVACERGLGEWVTEDVKQVTCPGCLEWVHA